MLTKESALEKALLYIQEKNPYKDLELVIIESETINKDYGWVFFYDSKKYLETDDISYALGGNGPIVVLKETSEIFQLGTAYDPEEEIEAFEKKFLRKK